MKNDGGAEVPKVNAVPQYDGSQPAFPFTGIRSDRNGVYEAHVISGGMTLRDYMAGQALVGLIDKFYYNSNLYQAQEPALAEKAYFIADAMIKARGD